MPKISAEARVSRRLRFRDLHVFLAVVECGSMGKAAVHLGTTQPSVSELIPGLESTIGARLFDRNAQGVEPTLYGQALSKRAIAAFDELKQRSLVHRSSGLKALPIVLPPHHYPIAIVTVKNRTLSPVVELFIERLRQFRKVADMTGDRARR